MGKPSLDLVRGTLDLLILKTLAWGAMHGYAIAHWIREQSDSALLVEEGALYPALYRMEARGWIEAEWGLSENNRKARYYRLSPVGRRQLRKELTTWAQYTAAVGKIIEATKKPALREA
jgi:PadR family transcriptional regulator, regulatory protein PadR